MLLSLFLCLPRVVARRFSLPLKRSLFFTNIVTGTCRSAQIAGLPRADWRDATRGRSPNKMTLRHAFADHSVSWRWRADVGQTRTSFGSESIK